MLIQSNKRHHLPHLGPFAGRRSTFSIIFFVILTLLCYCLLQVEAALPSIDIRDYSEAESVDIRVNKLDSVKTQLTIPYYSLPFCSPDVIDDEGNNSVGEIFTGDHSYNTAMDAFVTVDEMCKILCKKTYTKEQLKDFASKIEDEYRINWTVDGLPTVMKHFEDDDPSSVIYKKGFPLGGHIRGDRNKKFINNHVRMLISYIPVVTNNEEAADEKGQTLGYRIVGYEVEIASIRHIVEGQWMENASKLKTCNERIDIFNNKDLEPQFITELEKDDERTIIWTYDVHWIKSDVPWSARWDVFTKLSHSSIHWLSLAYSIGVFLLLSGVFAYYLARTLRKDVDRYNQLAEEESLAMLEADGSTGMDDLFELTATGGVGSNKNNVSDEIGLGDVGLTSLISDGCGWKLIYGDVFRPPRFPMLFSTLLGTGAQVFGMTVSVLIFAFVGLLSPQARGSLVSGLLLLFTLMGSVAGYVSTRVYSMHVMFLKGGGGRLHSWKRNTLLTAFLFPGIVFTCIFLFNYMVYLHQPESAIALSTLMKLLVAWFAISLPLVFCGSFLAFLWAPFKPKHPPNDLQRFVYPGEVKSRQWFAIVVGGLVPFTACFIEVYFLMSSIWLHQFYHVFSFAVAIFFILLITTAEITILLIYFQLCAGDFHWHWRSIFTGGAGSFYLLAFSIVYFFASLQIKTFIPALLYFGTMILVAIGFFLVTGTVGYGASFWFVNKIYSSIKID